MKKTLFVMMLAGVGFFTSSAHAGAIINLTDKTQTVELRTSDGYKPIEIPPGRKYYETGKAEFRYMGREVLIEHRTEYAIWPDGTFGPQQRMFGQGLSR